MMPSPWQLARTAVGVAGVFLVIVLLVALVTTVVDPGGARAALHFGFGHVPRVPQQALSIFLNNVLLLCVPFVMAGDLQIRRAISSSLGRRIYTGFCDLAAMAPGMHTGLIVGVSVGAYGHRMVAAMMPFGPIEIAAFALATSVYLAARRLDSIDALRSLIVPAGIAVVLLALAASIEALV